MPAERGALMNRSSPLVKFLAVVIVCLAAAAAWTPVLDDPASASLEDGTTRAFATFATARGLNAAISLLQGTEITGGVGLSATFSVGQVLDPLNDLVEQFADLMLLATVSFGVQQVLVGMGQALAVKIAVTGLLLAWAAWYAAGQGAPRWLGTVVILGLMARFAIPAAVVGSELVFDNFLADNYAASEEVVRQTRASVNETADVLAEAQQQADDADDGGWWSEFMDSARERANAAADWLDLPGRLGRLGTQVEGTVHHVVQLIVVFLLQTLILPLVILWALYMVARGFFASAGRSAAARLVEDRRDKPAP